jgi:hypothetical protein
MDLLSAHRAPFLLFFLVVALCNCSAYTQSYLDGAVGETVDMGMTEEEASGNAPDSSVGCDSKQDPYQFPSSGNSPLAPPIGCTSEVCPRPNLY